MTKFPEELSLTIVDDLFEHYELGYDENERIIHVFCERCDDMVCQIEFDAVENADEMDLYEKIIGEHRKI